MRSYTLVTLVLVFFLATATAAAPTKKTNDAAPTTPTTATPATSLYQQLGLTPVEGRDASLLKRTYRKLALQHHPDKATSEEDRAAKQAQFVKYSTAYEILSDPRLKTRYDYLLSIGQVEYDANRDWSDFDVSQGFKRQPKTAAQREAENSRKAAAARYKEAEEIFRKAAEEAEEFALWTAMSIAFGIALLPTIYIFYSRKANAIAEEKKRKSASSDLKASQAILLELQEEQQRQKKAAQAEERQYARELQREREAAAAAAAESGDVSTPAGGEGEESSWEVVDGAAKDSSAGATGEKGEGSEDESDEDDDSGKKVTVKCLLCKKSFKSQQQ